MVMSSVHSVKIQQKPKSGNAAHIGLIQARLFENFIFGEEIKNIEDPFTKVDFFISRESVLMILVTKDDFSGEFFSDEGFRMLMELL